MINPMIIVRGAGDLATGTIHRLWSAGFNVIVLEDEKPAAIRRQVSLCEAVYEGKTVVEGMTGIRVEKTHDALIEMERGNVPVIVDPLGTTINEIKPHIVIDAIMAKRNLGTNRGMAALTVALGPGFEAGVDTDYVIETKRGHNLGRIISEGFAIPNTGVPGNIGGYSAERVIHAQCEGTFNIVKNIGSVVKKGDVIAKIEGIYDTAYVKASIDGIIRGIIRNGYYVTKGFKIADIDPRKEELKNCFTISDKARCIAGSVLEIVCRFSRTGH